jgi:hypothetical protein
MISPFESLQAATRRHFLQQASLGLGGLAFAELAGGLRAEAPAIASYAPLAPRPPHFAPKAKRVIYLHMSGAPPHLDLFDYKPKLVEWERSSGLPSAAAPASGCPMPSSPCTMWPTMSP